VSGERLDVTPDATPAEEEAIRRALEALGLLERRVEPSGDGVPGMAPRAVTDP
jgi:predicted deacylase